MLKHPPQNHNEFLKTNEMFSERRFYQRVKSDYESRITLPKQNYFFKSACCVVLTYFIGTSMRFMTFESRERLAKFLLERGDIVDYSGIIDNVTMTRKTIHTMTGKKGEAIQWEAYHVYRWEDVDFTRDQVIELAAENEIMLGGGKLGYINKVIGFCKNVFQAA